jgi:3-dehydroquinate dehydratase
MKRLLLASAVALISVAAHAEEEPSLPDLIAQAVGTANEAGINPISLDQETLRKASVGGQIATSLIAGFGCADTARAVGDAFGIAIKVAQ